MPIKPDDRSGCFPLEIVSVACLCTPWAVELDCVYLGVIQFDAVVVAVYSRTVQFGCRGHGVECVLGTVRQVWRVVDLIVRSSPL